MRQLAAHRHAARALAGRAHDDPGPGAAHVGEDPARGRQVHDTERGGRNPHVRQDYERFSDVSDQHRQYIEY